ncbi:MAG: hypothetical protein HQL38_12990 [Alphaproteobacteria bacterium]|nr:hypothetical protein [Alphaproteobacteria bacterium]MBF0335557.1 hypothetical protein [Alphaproteobacteria bacterium]MBF0372625.1 hypothetical protein [Alphaproteobacteria bacterium]MBF0393587.1 hypothetical protein [Alphaproteobacteria bacterium]
MQSQNVVSPRMLANLADAMRAIAEDHPEAAPVLRNMAAVYEMRSQRARSETGRGPAN